MFKPLQVVLTTKPLCDLKGHPIAVGTRVVVINVKDSTVTARGKRRPSPTKRAYRIVGHTDAFAVLKRGRPVEGKTKRTAKVVAVSTPVVVDDDIPATLSDANIVAS